MNKQDDTILAYLIAASIGLGLALTLIPMQDALGPAVSLWAKFNPVIAQAFPYLQFHTSLSAGGKK